MGDKFELVAYDKGGVVQMVDELGATMAEEKDKSIVRKAEDAATDFVTGHFAPGAKKAIADLGLDSREGRQKFLREKLGVDGATPDNYRLVTYTNDSGQVMFFRGHMNGDGKLVLTDSIAAPDKPEQLQQLLQSSFKSLPRPIVIQIEKTTATEEGQKLDLSPEERKKLETQASLAAVIHNAGDVQLTSNTRLPGTQQTTGFALKA